MSSLLEAGTVLASPETDLAGAVDGILAASAEPLSLGRIFARLGPAHRKVDEPALLEYAYRQVAARVYHLYPRYRSRQVRFWDRPMPVHIAWLFREALARKPLAWPDLRRRLPAYAVAQAEQVLIDEVRKGTLFRHPRLGNRGSDRFGIEPPDPAPYLRDRLEKVFMDLQQLGFPRDMLRGSALQLLHEEEWASEQRRPARALKREAGSRILDAEAMLAT